MEYIYKNAINMYVAKPGIYSVEIKLYDEKVKFSIVDAENRNRATLSQEIPKGKSYSTREIYDVILNNCNNKDRLSENLHSFDFGYDDDEVYCWIHRLDDNLDDNKFISFRVYVESEKELNWVIGKRKFAEGRSDLQENNKFIQEYKEISEGFQKIREKKKKDSISI